MASGAHGRKGKEKEEKGRERRKTNKHEEERLATIRRANEVLVQHIAETISKPSYISLSPPAYPASKHRAPYHHSSLNYVIRKREHDRIARENLALAKRLMRVQQGSAAGAGAGAPAQSRLPPLRSLSPLRDGAQTERTRRPHREGQVQPPLTARQPRTYLLTPLKLQQQQHQQQQRHKEGKEQKGQEVERKEEHAGRHERKTGGTSVPAPAPLLAQPAAPPTDNGEGVAPGTAPADDQPRDSSPPDSEPASDVPAPGL